MKPSSKHYVIANNPSERQKLICFSLDSTRPDAYMSALENDLLENAHQGEVLLDLLASNGDGSRRFMRLNFDGKKLHWLSAKITARSSLDSSTLAFCDNFYANRIVSLTHSVMSPATRHRIKSRSSLVAA